MLKLININKNGTYIEANYIPESSEELGYIKLDIENREIIEAVPTSYDKTFKIYQGHARRALIKLAGNDVLPERYPVAWY